MTVTLANLGIIDEKTLAAMFGMRPDQWRAHAADGTVPQPLDVPFRRRVYRIADIDAWVDGLDQRSAPTAKEVSLRSVAPAGDPPSPPA